MLEVDGNIAVGFSRPGLVRMVNNFAGRGGPYRPTLRALDGSMANFCCPRLRVMVGVGVETRFMIIAIAIAGVLGCFREL